MCKQALVYCQSEYSVKNNFQLLKKSRALISSTKELRCVMPFFTLTLQRLKKTTAGIATIRPTAVAIKASEIPAITI
jgi:hypothetical protein